MAYGGHLLPETTVFSTAELSLVEVRGCDILRLEAGSVMGEGTPDRMLAHLQEADIQGIRGPV